MMLKKTTFHYCPNYVILSPRRGRPKKGRFQLHLDIFQGKLNRRISCRRSFAPLGLRMTASGQTMIEFSFCMIIVVVLLLGMIKVFVWSGKDLVERRRAHERILTNRYLSPQQQIRPVFYFSTRFDADIDSNMYEQ